MKTAFPVFLILLLGAVLAGPVLLRTILKQRAKAEMKQRLAREGSMLTFTSAELKDAQWPNTDEFRLGGRLYDVSSIQLQSNGSVLYYCLSDDLETLAEQKADALTDDATGRSNSPRRRLVKAFINWLQDCCFPSPYVQQGAAYGSHPPKYYNLLPPFFLSCFIEVVNPPPEA